MKETRMSLFQLFLPSLMSLFTLAILHSANFQTLGLVLDIPAPIEPFVGRQELLDTLYNLTYDTSNWNHDQPLTIGLHGPNGVGKRQLALKLVHVMRMQAQAEQVEVEEQSDPDRPRFRHFVWLNAHSERSLQDSFIRLASHPQIQLYSRSKDPKAEEASLTNTLGLESPFPGLMVRIYKKLCQDASLFIINLNLKMQNGKHTKVSTFLRPFLPSPAHRRKCQPAVFIILLHSKKSLEKLREKHEVRPVIGKMIEIPKFSEEESVTLISQKLQGESSSSESNAKILHEALEGHPLAIGQALAFVQERDKDSVQTVGIPQFIKRFTQLFLEYRGDDPEEIEERVKGKTPRRKRPDPRQRRSRGQEKENDPKAKPKKASPLFLSFFIAREKLEESGKQGQRALKILEILAFLPEGNIKVEVDFILEILKEDENPKDVEKALKELEKFGMIHRRKRQSLEIHAGVQKMTLRQMKKNWKPKTKASQLDKNLEGEDEDEDDFRRRRHMEEMEEERQNRHPAAASRLPQHFDFLLERCAKVLERMQSQSEGGRDEEFPRFLENIEFILDRMEAVRPRFFDLLKILELKSKLVMYAHSLSLANLPGRGWSGWRVMVVWREIFNSVKKINGFLDDKGAQSRVAAILTRLKESQEKLGPGFVKAVQKMALEILSQSTRFTREILEKIGLEPRANDNVNAKEDTKSQSAMSRDEL